MVPKFFVLLFLAGVACLSVSAQDALAPSAPLLRGDEIPLAAGESLATLSAAQSAQELGFPSLAAALYRRVLAAPAGAGGHREQITLALVSALLDDGDIAGAEHVLHRKIGLRGSSWHLRAGLIAAYQRKFDVAAAELQAAKPEELTPAERGWRLFLQGMLAEPVDLAKATALHNEAERAPGLSELQRARFALAHEQLQLRTGPISEAQLRATRSNMENLQGRKAGYGFARNYATMLDAVGRRSEAIEVLRRQLFALPAEERTEKDRFQLLLGLIAGAGEGAGRNALYQLLADGNDPGKQRIALQLLARATKPPAQAEFRRKLDELIGAPTPHPILEELLLFRAQAALADKEYAQADLDANTLLQKFPASSLKAHALGILTNSAWAQRKYRTTADYAAKARAELPSGQTRAELGVLGAEAWYRAALISRSAADFRSAAEAYAAALRDRPDGVKRGTLLFQRVLAETEAAKLDTAQIVPRLTEVQVLLDELSRDPGFEPVNRWQAEWNLARALQVAGETAAAYTRVNQLLATPLVDSSILPMDLRVRMAWLQARLSLETGKPQQTLTLADALVAMVGSAEGLDAALRIEIASITALLKAQANFALGQENAAVEVLKKLRADFPKSAAEVYSYIVEADYHAGKDRTVEAQQLLTRLADNFPESGYAPLALYQAARYAERRGNFKEANDRLEQLIKRYPQSELVFTARLEQGDLLRKLNHFPLAQQVYESIITGSQHPGVLAAKLALADCHSAQAMTDASHAKRAEEIYEGLLAWPTAPVDLRVEAGFKLGENRARRGHAARAEEVWWRDVIEPFLLNPEKARELGATGRWWMSRTLLRLGDLREQQVKLEEAKRAWLLILETKLPGEGTAKSKLARFNLPEVKS